MKAERIQFLSVGDVMGIHDDVLADTGGAAGVLNPGTLEGAVMAVQATFGGRLLYGSIADIAAAYLVNIATSHPFVDGNKRTAVATALNFLEINGHVLVLAPDDVWIDIVGDVAVGDIPHEKLAEVIANEMGEWDEIE